MRTTDQITTNISRPFALLQRGRLSGSRKLQRCVLLLFALVVPFILSVGLVFHSPPTRLLDLGTKIAQPYLHGFYKPERNAQYSYAYTGDQAQILVPRFSGRLAIATLHFDGSRPVGVDQARVSIGTPTVATTFVSAPQLRSYHLLMPISGSNLDVRIVSTVFRAGRNDPRQLGIPLDSFEARGVRSEHLLQVVPLMLALAASLYLFLHRLFGRFAISVLLGCLVLAASTFSLIVSGIATIDGLVATLGASLILHVALWLPNLLTRGNGADHQLQRFRSRALGSRSEGSNTVTVRQHLHLWRVALWRLAVLSTVIILTLIPIIRITSIVASTGANNVSNDYITYGPLVDQMLSGKYNWSLSNYFQDTFLGGAHSFAFPFLIRLAIIKYFHWDIYLELYIGLITTVLKLFLLYDSLTYGTQRTNSLFLLPMLSALVFAVSQINVWTFGDAALQIGFTQLGVALAVWGLVRFEGRSRGVALSVLGGVMASWSGGGGLPIWPMVLIGMIMLNYRQTRFYALWFGGASLAILPYVAAIVLWPKARATGAMSLLNYEFIIAAIGWPFSQNFSLPAAETAGWTGSALCLLGLSLLYANRHNVVPKRSSAPLMLLTYTIINIWLVSAFRGSGAAGLAPWYTGHFILFWVGLLGLAYAVCLNRVSHPAASARLVRGLSFSTSLWGFVVTGILTYLYATSNITYADKVMYLYSRSPTSAACLRNYRTAPTYCEQYLFQWGVGRPTLIAALAQPLERHNLSVFAPHQRWTLQGDYVLDTVHTQKVLGAGDIGWSADLSAASASWQDYRHLNLFLHSPNTVSWTVTLPANATQVAFHSAVAMSTRTPNLPGTDGATFEVYVDQTTGASKLAFSKHLDPNQRQWHPFSVSLDAFIGQTITIRLTSDGGRNIAADWAMYRYPYIDLVLDTSRPVAPAPRQGRFIPQRTAADVRFDISDSSLWEVTNMQRLLTGTSTPPEWSLNQAPQMSYNRPLSICLADYTHFYVRMAAETETLPRAMKIYFRVDSQPAFDEAHSVTIPLLPGRDVHDYSYDLKLLGLPSATHLTGIRLDPIFSLAPLHGERAQIVDFRLIRGNGPTGCAS